MEVDITKGRLVSNGGRPDIAYENGTMYGGLHCGDCILCRVDGETRTVRVEYDDDWYGVCDGQVVQIPYGCEVC